MRQTVFVFFFLMYNIALFAQINFQMFCNETQIVPQDSMSLQFGIENTNFFKNNEYFNDITKGYTLIGASIHPKLLFFPSERTKLAVGVFALKYSGIDKFSETQPTIRFHFQANPNIAIVMGNIYGAANHRLTEPMYGFERRFNRQIENGVQFLFDYGHFFSDTWLQWEQFIFHQSPYQEQLAIGTKNTVRFFDHQQRFGLEIPFDATGFHKGGQIDTCSTPLTTLLNAMTGIHFSIYTGGFIQQLSVKNHFYLYKDFSNAKQQAFTDGSAYYFALTTKFAGFSTLCGYWNGNRYISPYGEAIFQNVSDYGDFSQENRELLTFKLLYEKKICRGGAIGAGFEGFYDPDNHLFDYSYSLHIVFNRNFMLIKNIR